MNSLTAQQLRIERLKQVREQSKRHYSARLEKYKGIREKDRNAKYEIAKAKKCVKVLNDLEVLSHNWNQSLIETGSAHRNAPNAHDHALRLQRDEKERAVHNAKEAKKRTNKSIIEFRKYEDNLQFKHKQSAFVGATRIDYSAHEREEARTVAESIAAKKASLATKRRVSSYLDPKRFVKIP